MAIYSDGPQKIQAIFADRGAPLTATEAKLLNALLGRERVLTLDEIVTSLYGDRADGGPLSARSTVRKVIFFARCKLYASGVPWQLVSVGTRTSGIRGYQLRYIEPLWEEARMAA